MVNVPSSPREPVVGRVDAVAQHEAVLGELVGDRQHGGADALVVAGKEAHDRDEQDRRVEVLGVVVLHEDAAVVDALLEDLRAASRRPRPATARRARRRRAPARGAAPRSTATQHITFDATKCCGSPRISQMPWSGSGNALDRLVDEVADALPDRGRDLPAAALVDGDRVEQHPPHVVLVLVEGTVADAHRARVPVPGEVVERVLGEIGLAADPVHDLQVPLTRRRLRRAASRAGTRSTRTPPTRSRGRAAPGA